METTFSINRVGLFIKRQFITNRNEFGIVAALLVGVFIVFNYLSAQYKPLGFVTVNSILVLFLIVFGHLLSIRLFKELQSKEKSIFYLTLPVSNFEKLLSSWIISGPVYIGFSLLVLWLFKGLGILLADIYQLEASFMQIPDPDIAKTIWMYLIFQSIFLFGAVAFRKRNFIKTVLLIICAAILYFVLMSLFLSAGMAESMGDFQKFEETVTDSKTLNLAMNYVFPAIDVFCFYILAPLMLLLTYFKLKNRQV